MRILVTNDDGIRAPGLRTLVEVAQGLGEVKVVAPDRERSACAHAMTMREPLRISRFEWEGVEAYEATGVPTDCVNLGLAVAWPDGCDLVLSGINNGPNLGFDVTYSGTAAGAMEGTINGIYSIAISVASFVTGAPIHFDTAAAWLKEYLPALANAPRRERTFLNVNIPNFNHADELRGHRVAAMGKRVYLERIECRQDPWGRDYWWQGGAAVMTSGQPDTDVQAAADGFVAITPVTVDWTDYEHLETLRESLKRPAHH